MECNIENHAKKILNAIVSAMKIKHYDLCLCGSGKKYKKCCDKQNADSIIFTKTAFENVLKYQKSRGGKIQQIPQGLLKKFTESSLNRFCCLYPNCTNQTSLCHSIPKNILKKSFGTHCLEAKLQDGLSDPIFTKTGIGLAGTLPVFCETHDNNLFSKIDELKIDFSNKEHLFLLTFKAISFSLRHVQYLLGIDFQVEIFRPILFLNNQKNISIGTHVELEISKHLEKQYLRFKITNEVFKTAVAVLEKERYNDFSYLYRNFKYEKNFFFSGFINPLYDLNDNRINNPKTPINMTINIFTKDKKLHILLACPPKSKKSYAIFFKQLKEADIKTFVDALNKMIVSAADKLLLPLNYNPENNFIDLTLIKNAS